MARGIEPVGLLLALLPTLPPCHPNPWLFLDAGKTALAATLAMRSEFPLIKMITPETMVGYSEYAKVAKINKVGWRGCEHRA